MGNDFENPFGLVLKSGKPQKMSHLINMAVFPVTRRPLMHIIMLKQLPLKKLKNLNLKIT